MISSGTVQRDCLIFKFVMRRNCMLSQSGVMWRDSWYPRVFCKGAYAIPEWCYVERLMLSQSVLQRGICYPRVLCEDACAISISRVLCEGLWPLVVALWLDTPAQVRWPVAGHGCPEVSAGLRGPAVVPPALDTPSDRVPLEPDHGVRPR